MLRNKLLVPCPPCHLTVNVCPRSTLVPDLGYVIFSCSLGAVTFIDTDENSLEPVAVNA